MTVKYDKTSLWLLIGAFVVPVLVSVGVVLLVDPGNPLMWIISIVLGVMVGLLLAMYTLNWRAEKVAFSQLEGKPGAAGAVLTSSLRGRWQTSDTPVAFNAKTQDAVFRAVGKPGIVLVSEGNPNVCKRLVGDERRRVQRIVPNVDIIHIHVGNGEGQTPLLKLRRSMRKLPKKLQKTEILAVSNRLRAMPSSSLPIPKGIDPNRIRPSRAHLR
ncbi:hypothetical protein GCM10011490_04780 [Pseudoclavibacter endophyticus]|nr:hypothetical protein GCM10011490_04780 [Pseudoclavibacter endophyticus]